LNTLFGEPISSFSGEYRWLSNFWLADITLKGLTFPSSENAYQAAKTVDWANDAKQFTTITPGQAKRLGQTVEMTPVWDKIKNEVMFNVCWRKFKAHPELGQMLIDTGDRPLIEGNTWGDKYWGQCPVGQGENRLGKILENIRSSLNDLN